MAARRAPSSTTTPSAAPPVRRWTCCATTVLNRRSSQYLKTPPSRDELVRMIRDAGIDVRTAVRKRESLYAELNLADASDDQLLDAMAEHPILIERPFVVTPKGTRLARPIDAVREIL